MSILDAIGCFVLYMIGFYGGWKARGKEVERMWEARKAPYHNNQKR